jgi:hypothetical protein
VRHATLVGVIPAGEVLLNNTVNSLDAQLVDEWVWTFFDIGKCTDETAYIGRNSDDALHGFNLAETFDDGLCFGAMSFGHVKCPLIASIVFGSTQGEELGRIILADKGKNRDSIHSEQ